MQNQTVVVALGGNALVKKGQIGSIHEQFANTRASLDGIIKLLKEDNKIVITHGNGPVVGNIMLRVQAGLNHAPKMPLGICVADSQGGIGYMIQQCLQNRLKQEKIDKCVATVITQVLVDKDDPAMANPTKPVGPFYSKEQAKELKEKNPDWIMKEDAGRGYRRVVSSPNPIDIIEKRSIRQILKDGFIVIAAGGGGIPVYYDNKGRLEGFDAVVDKDLASYVLAREINANILILLTNVDSVYLNFNKPDQRELRNVSLGEIKRDYDAGHFPEGSMGPKIKAAILFLEQGGEKVIITSIERFVDALHGKVGTVIKRGF